MKKIQKITLVGIAILALTGCDISKFDLKDVNITVKEEQNNTAPNILLINTLNARYDKEKLIFDIGGNFSKESHVDFYIDSDNNPDTGYSNGVIKGADYLIEDSKKLYLYPEGETGWKWKMVSSQVSGFIKDNSATSTIQLSDIHSPKHINYTASISSHDWKEKVSYEHMKPLDIESNHYVITIGPRKIIPTPKERATIIAAPNGNGDACTLQKPCSIETAFDKIRQGGDVLFLRGGVYTITDQLLVYKKPASQENPIIIESYPGEKAIIQGKFVSGEYAKNHQKQRHNGIKIISDYVKIRNLQIRYMGYEGIFILYGNHNTVEGCELDHNMLAGVAVYGGEWDEDNENYKIPYPNGKYNLIQDNIVHDNSDIGLEARTKEGRPADGGNADGISISSGSHNSVVHNEVYHNSDDGIDTWRSNDSYVAYNISHDNGLGQGDGNGFKAGGNDNPNAGNGRRTMLEHNIAYNNRANGFDWNSGKEDVFVYNTAYNNGNAGFKTGDDAAVQYNIASHNNISHIGIEGSYNSWNIEGDVQFMSTEPSSEHFLEPIKDSIFSQYGAYAKLGEKDSFDTTPPVITLKGSQTMTLRVGDKFADPGAIATDNKDGKVNVNVSGTVDTTKAGTYTITYTATDKAGNKVIKTRTVIIKKKAAPSPAGDIPKIKTLNAVYDNDKLAFSVTGTFANDSHVDIFIDSDNNPDTGYSNGVIKGADYLIEDSKKLYLYPEGETGWKWDEASDDVFGNIDDNQASTIISLSDIQNPTYINYTASVSSHDWKEKVSYDHMKPLDIGVHTAILTPIDDALKNPLKGMTTIFYNSAPKQYVSIRKQYVLWNQIEENKDDGIDKIIQFTKDEIDKIDNRSISSLNIKSMPRILLEGWDNGYPNGLTQDDHYAQNQKFIDRIKNLIPKVAKVWDNDPSIGFVQMGIYGKWGEQSEPETMSGELAKVLGDLFSKSFKNKKVMVRIPNYFSKWYLSRHNDQFWGKTYSHYYDFGLYWDSFTWKHEDNAEVFDYSTILSGSKMWKSQPIVGEVAFNVDLQHLHDCGEYNHRESDPKDRFSCYDKNTNQNISAKAIHDNLVEADKLDYLKDYIYSTHCTALSWISLYNPHDPQELKAAEELQKAMGYRFVLQKATYGDSVEPGKKLHISFDVTNMGSAPFYYRWPVKVSLLDKNSKRVVYSQKLSSVDIRTWQPGDDWDFDANRYLRAPKTYTESGDISIPEYLEAGEYILALSINDPAGDLPAIKFANKEYYNGGRTPLGIVGIGIKSESLLPPFDNVISDNSLHYIGAIK